MWKWTSVSDEIIVYLKTSLFSLYQYAIYPPFVNQPFPPRTLLYSPVTRVTRYYSGGLKQKGSMSWFWRLEIQQKLTLWVEVGYHQDHTFTSLEAPGTSSLSLVTSDGYSTFWLVTISSQTPLIRSQKRFLF